MQQQPLPDILDFNLKVIFIGFNPGLRSTELGHHYAGKNNRFWSLLYKSGLLPLPLTAEEDHKLLQYGYGSTNIIDRPSKSADELTKEEFAVGREILKDKLALYQPQVACYMGIGVYRQFAKIRKFESGLQSSSVILGIKDFVISSPSGLNRTSIEEQLQLYCELKKLVEGENHF